MATTWLNIQQNTKNTQQYGTFNDFKEDEAKGERDEDSDVVSLMYFLLYVYSLNLFSKWKIRFEISHLRWCAQSKLIKDTMPAYDFNLNNVPQRSW